MCRFERFAGGIYFEYRRHKIISRLTRDPEFIMKSVSEIRTFRRVVSGVIRDNLNNACVVG